MNISRLKYPELAGMIGLLIFAFLSAATVKAAEVTISVEDNGGTAVSGFRWLLQEDTTFAVDPANPPTTADEMLSLNFHSSFHPVAQNAAGAGLSGNSDGTFATIEVPDGRYYVSVLPYENHSISGASVVVDGAPTAVTVITQAYPIPTATITAFLFHDNYPINGSPDLPQESAPSFLPGSDTPIDWSEFSIILEEPGGRYGIAGGQVIQDVFGNPLGTVYNKTCDFKGDVPTTGVPGVPPNNHGCFNADGEAIVVSLGDGTLHPDAATGLLTIENLAPGKYGVIAIPATGSNWQQTSTIEGTKVIDAWVKANEPHFFVEFGPPGPHVFIGFVKAAPEGFFPFSQPPGTTVTTTISGTITDMHLSRAPSTQLYSGRPFPGCWVGLNENVGGLAGPGVYAGACDGDSGFSIPNVPPGDYQMKVFDANMDVVIATLGVSVDEFGSCLGALSGCNYGEVPVFNWFTRLNTGVFNDENQNGFWDDGENGIGPESQDVGIRWRDGTIYQNFPTDGDGLAPFDEVFPFFHWLVAEVSFGNKKATGATFVADAGGPVDKTTDAFPGFGELTPQEQFCTAAQSGNIDDPNFGCTVGDPLVNLAAGDNLSWTDTGQVLTAAFQGFLGQTSVMLFGKTDYVNFDYSALPATYVGENGGISGIVYYATTRAENEPQFAAAEEWEPGVPRVQLALYADGDIDSFPLGDFPGVGDIDWNGNGTRQLDDNSIDDINGIPGIQMADVDNAPLGNFPGPEDVDHNGNNAFDLGDALQVTWTDSWDDSLPEGCQGDNGPVIPEISSDRCFDGLRNFNQVRPGVFDGGFAFTDYDMNHLGTVAGTPASQVQAFYDYIDANVAGAGNLQIGLIPGDYIVESATPPGYEHIKEEDRNVDFGDRYIVSAQALAVACVGSPHDVPALLSMATKDGSGDLGQILPGLTAADVGAPYAGDTRPMCDLKKVPLSAGQNAAAEFFLMTDVPVVANVSGITLNDLANEFNPNSPAFSEKFAPPLLPIAFYDWNGKLMNRIYGDPYGRYNAVVPSTITANLGQPSGMSPNMLISCMNDAGPIANPDPDGPALITDPFFDSQYSQFCYTFQYMPGTITYLDTPVVSVSAFATSGPNPVDCERPTSTPMIASVTNSDQTGPFVLPGDDIDVRSMGFVDVPNPDWDGTDITLKNIERDYRFPMGPKAVYLISADGTRTMLPNGGANNRNLVTRTVTGVPPGDYQVAVVGRTSNGGGAMDIPETETVIGVTLTVGTGPDTGLRPDGGSYAVHRVAGPAAYPATPIQDVIDDVATQPGDLILVPPGSYEELVIMHKPVKLQGWGAGEVYLNARQVPTEKVSNWRAKAANLIAEGAIDQLPGQALGIPGFPALTEAVFPTEEGAAIFVAGKRTGANRFGRIENRFARIDGFTILGASTGGGIIANGYAQYLQIANNRITANAGAFGGGIRIGHPNLSHEENGGLVYDDARNDNIRIHHNHIVKNGGFGGAGGGLSMYTGADNYRVQDNMICGNFTQGSGAGIAHLGLSRNGLIEDNHIIFNESFTQANAQAGGGVFVGGQTGLEPNGQGRTLTPGTGNVTIDANIIRGNLAGAGDGGGIRLAAINGQDVDDNLGSRTQWYRVNVFNNMITNNAAGLAGGGISMSDALRVNIRNNTVANNDSTATTAEAFVPGNPNLTVAQPAGIVSRQHSGDLLALMVDANSADTVPADWLTFSDPSLRDNIVHQNRSFYWTNYDDPTTVTLEVGLVPATCSDPTDPLNDPTCDASLVAVADYTDDLGVLSVLAPAALLNPRFSLLTDDTGYHGSNSIGDPAFVNSVLNGPRDALNVPEFTTLQTAGAFDEGGNFIQVVFGPLSLTDENGDLYDYHLGAGSAANNAGGATPTTGRLSVDFDNDARPAAAGASDIGADE